MIIIPKIKFVYTVIPPPPPAYTLVVTLPVILPTFLKGNMSRASPHHFQLEHLKTVHEKGMAVADPDLELRVGGRGRDLVCLPWWLFFLLSFLLFLSKMRGKGGAGLQGPFLLILHCMAIIGVAS